MNVSVPQELAAVDSLDQLYPWLNARSMMALWHKPTASLYLEPKKNFLPMHWRWREGRAALDRAGGLISAELAHRRNLLLYNPADANGYAAVRTMVSAYQMILPGETAPSHRHSGNALRVILEGEGAYTIVEGERLDMKTNDVILTPHWTWHGHSSDADEPCYWLDALDTPLVHLLEPMFLENYPDGLQRATARPETSPYIFAWDQVQASLDKAALDPDDHFGRRIELGAPAFPTMAIHMQRHYGGTSTRQFRTTSNQIFLVIEGEGTTDVDGERYTWSRGDVIAVPAWRPFAHRFGADSTLFSTSDEPALRAFGWLRTQDA
jgi:gentisate 1,2-dioxygenase